MIYRETLGSPHNSACLLISGAMQGTWGWSDTFSKKLVEAEFYVIRFDHRDIGRSPESKEEYTIHQLAKDVVDILDELEIKKAHLVGHSMGGYICQEVAIAYPERVRSICAIASGPICATAETEKPLSQEEQSMLKNTWKVFLERKDGAGIEGYLDVYRYLSGSNLMDESLAKKYVGSMLKHSSPEMLRPGNPHEKVMQRLTESMSQRKEELRKINVPALIIHGEKDPLCLSRHARSLAEALPIGKFKLIKGMGHMFLSETLESKIAPLLIQHMRDAENEEKY